MPVTYLILKRRGRFVKTQRGPAAAFLQKRAELFPIQEQFRFFQQRAFFRSGHFDCLSWPISGNSRTPPVFAAVNAQGRWVFYKRKSAPVIRCAIEGAPAKGCPAGFCGEKEGRRSSVRNVPARAGRFEQSAALPDAAPPARLEPTTIPSPEIVALHRGLLPAAHRSVSGPASASLHRPLGALSSGAVNSRPAPFCLFNRFCFIAPRRFLRLLTHRVVCALQKKKRTGYPMRFFLAPPVGLEPTTLRLTAACSTD